MLKKIATYIRYQYAKYLFDRESFTFALPMFKKILYDNPSGVDGYINVGVTYLNLNEPEKALIYFEKGLTADKSNWILNENLYHTYLELNDKEKAHEALDRLIAVQPENYFHYLRKAGLYGKNDNSKNLEFSEKALALNPDDALCYTQLSIALWNAGRQDEALSALDEALSIDPVESTALNNYGYYLSKMGRYSDALPYFDTAIEVYPEFAYPYNNAGLCYLRLGRHEEAIKNINYSIELDPENSYAFKNRALYYIDVNDKTKAIEDLYKAKELGYTEQYGEEVDDLIFQLTNNKHE
jgi:tetratricopeptide (TPR) repeat protein